MKIICKKTDLAKAVQTVAKAVPAKATTSILECLLLRAEKEEITLTGNNLELGIETVMPGNIEEEGSIAIQAKVFGEIVRKLPEGDVVLETGEKDQATVRCKKTKYNLSVKSAEEYTCIPDMERKNHVTISEFDLKEAIRQTIFSVADTSSKKAMTGELWEINGKELKIVALDGHRISLRKIKLKKEYEPRKVIVPGKTLAEIIKIIGGDPEKEIAVYFTENHIQFEIENTRAISRLIEGEYLKVEQLLSKDYGTKIKVQKKELQECIDRASLLLKDDAKKPIILNIEENILSLEAASNMGSMNESMFVVKEGEKLRIGFNPKFLLEMLRVIDDEEVFCRIFFSNRDFITYFIKENRWSIKTLDILEAEKGKFISQIAIRTYKEKRSIQQFFHCTDDAVDSIQLIQIEQQKRKAEKSLKRKKRSIKDIESLFRSVKPVTGRFEKWLEYEVLKESQYIFYQYSRRKMIDCTCAIWNAIT